MFCHIENVVYKSCEHLRIVDYALGYFLLLVLIQTIVIVGQQSGESHYRIERCS